MKKLILLVFAIVLSLLCLPVSSGRKLTFAQNINGLDDINSKSAYLYDAQSKTVIFEKDSDKRLPIASMTKVATLALVFDAIEEGKLSEDQMITISQTAADVEGSQAFLDAGSQYKVSDLILTVIVCSANDSSVALAEQVGGSEQGFVNKMNDLAKNLNLNNTHFENATGLPAIDHYSSAKDISIIYSLICDNPIYKKYSKIWMTELVHPSGRKTEIVNTNRLIRSYEGCDSGKTGYTSEAGYCLVASATRQEMRLVGVVIGASDSKIRFNQMAKLFNYGFSNFENKVVLSKDVPIYSAKIKNALESNVNLYAKQDYVKFLRKGEEFDYTLNFKVGKLKAPIGKNEEVGMVYIIDNNNMVIDQIPLVAKEEVKAIKINQILEKIYSNF